jgi:SAM-dependent methyltransferase
VEEVLYERLREMEDEHWWFRGRRAVIRALTERAGSLPVEPRILDAGCGTGRNLVDYSERGRAEGIEPSETAVRFCRERGLDVSQGVLESLPYEDARFDLVFASDVLEHVEADVAALRELRRVAKTGAGLVVTVPAYTWLWSHHDDTHHHVRRYTRGLLARHARAGGWEPTFSSYFNSLLLAPIAVVRLLQRGRPAGGRSDYERTPALLNSLLERPMAAEARLLARGWRLPVGVSIGMVCRAAGP